MAIALPLIFGVLFHHLTTAVIVAIGALLTGFADLSGAWQRRVRSLMGAIMWITVATWLGIATGPIVSVAAVLVSAGAAGLLTAISPEAAQMGTMGTISLVVFSGLGRTGGTAPVTAVEVLAGGCLQLLLMVLLIPRKPADTASKSLTEVLVQLIQYSLDPTREADFAVDRAFAAAEDQIEDPATSPQQKRKCSGLLLSLDLIRNDIVALQSVPDEVASKPLFMSHVAFNLKILLAALDPGDNPNLPTSAEPSLPRHADLGEHPLRHEILSRFEHIAKSAEQFLRVVRGESLGPPVVKENVPLRQTFRRAALTACSDVPARQHTLRLLAALLVAELLFRMAHLPRGYWIGLTVLVVLKPDFLSTMGRGFSRALGTLAGVVLATAFILVAGREVLFGLVATVVLAFLLYSLIRFNYALYSALISAEILVLLSFFENTSPILTMQERVLATLLGCALAMAAYGLFPTWQRSALPDLLAHLVQAEQDYLGALLRHEATVFARRETRRWRSRLDQAINTVLNEPAANRLPREKLLGLLRALDDLTMVLMGLEWHFAGGSPVEEGFLTQANDMVANLALLHHHLATHLEPPSADTRTGHAFETISDPYLRHAARTMQQAWERMCSPWS